jgi:hypothetical protein
MTTTTHPEQWNLANVLDMVYQSNQWEDVPADRCYAAARLMAAAPDLLEAVMLAEENLAPIYASDHIVLRKLRAAIGAATAVDPRR